MLGHVLYAERQELIELTQLKQEQDKLLCSAEGATLTDLIDGAATQCGT